MCDNGGKCEACGGEKRAASALSTGRKNGCRTADRLCTIYFSGGKNGVKTTELHFINLLIYNILGGWVSRKPGICGYQRPTNALPKPY